MRDLMTSKLRRGVSIRVISCRLRINVRSIENSSKGSSGGAGDEIVQHLSLLGLLLGQNRLDLVDDTKVTGVPGNVSPHGALESVVHGQNSLLGDNLAHDIDHARVLAGGGLVLQANLDELEGDDNERLGRSSSGTSQNRQGLGLLSHAEGVAVDFPPLVVGGKFRCSAGYNKQFSVGGIEFREPTSWAPP